MYGFNFPGGDDDIILKEKMEEFVSACCKRGWVMVLLKLNSIGLGSIYLFYRVDRYFVVVQTHSDKVDGGLFIEKGAQMDAKTVLNFW